MAIEGVDYTTTDRPSIASLLASGKAFACRYGGPGGAWKQLTAAERDELHAAGIAIVANAEGTADGLKGGYTAGVSWSRDALAFWTALGLPAGRPIYFSVDFDTTTGDWDELDAAFDGIASVIGVARTGVYGEYSIVKHLAGNGKAKWLWQAYAWSGGQWYAGNHIEQYRNGVPLGGGTVDLNRAMVADYGQWTPQGDDMADTDGAIAEQYRILALLTLNPDWAKDPHVVDAGKLASVPVIDLLKRLDTAAAQLLAKSAPTATVDPVALQAAVDKAVSAQMPGLVDAVSTAVADKLAKRLAS